MTDRACSAQAMRSDLILIGENRPYCTALLWAQGDTAGLEKKIAHVNSGLSHPEQIRKYRPQAGDEEIFRVLGIRY